MMEDQQEDAGWLIEHLVSHDHLLPASFLCRAHRARRRPQRSIYALHLAENIDYLLFPVLSGRSRPSNPRSECIRNRTGE